VITVRNGYLRNRRLLSLTFIATAFHARGAVAQMPPAIVAPGETTVAAVHAGAFLSVPYSAEYVFLRKGG